MTNFTTTELEKMVADYSDFGAQLQPDDALQIHFPGHVRREISRDEAYALQSNAVQIAKQLLKVVQGKEPAGQYSEQVLETMIVGYETYWQVYSRGLSCGDIETDLANKLVNNIFWITTELLAELLRKELIALQKEVTSLLVRPHRGNAWFARHNFHPPDLFIMTNKELSEKVETFNRLAKWLGGMTVNPLDEMWEELGRDLMKGCDESEVNRLLAKGIPVYYSENDDSEEMVKEYPDGHKEIVIFQGRKEVVLRPYP
jgi:hypothetical protein